MNHSAKIGARGQITLPADIRKSLGLAAGDSVEFVPTAAGNFELVPHSGGTSGGQNGPGRLKGLFARPASTIDVEQAISETVKRRVTADRSEVDP